MLRHRVRQLSWRSIDLLASPLRTLLALALLLRSTPATTASQPRRRREPSPRPPVHHSYALRRSGSNNLVSDSIAMSGTSAVASASAAPPLSTTAPQTNPPQESALNTLTTAIYGLQRQMSQFSSRLADVEVRTSAAVLPRRRFRPWESALDPRRRFPGRMPWGHHPPGLPRHIRRSFRTACRDSVMCFPRRRPPLRAEFPLRCFRSWEAAPCQRRRFPGPMLRDHPPLGLLRHTRRPVPTACRDLVLCLQRRRLPLWFSPPPPPPPLLFPSPTSNFHTRHPQFPLSTPTKPFHHIPARNLMTLWAFLAITSCHFRHLTERKIPWAG